MVKMVNEYPVIIESGNHNLRLDISKNKENEFECKITIMHHIKGYWPSKTFTYTFETEVNLFEEAISLIEEQMHRATIKEDYESESELLDIFLELGKIKQTLKGDK